MADLKITADFSDIQTLKRELLDIPKTARSSASVFEREFARVERQLKKSAIASQEYYRETLNLDRAHKSAAKSAEVFERELLAQERALSKNNTEFRRLKASIDPAYKAQQQLLQVKRNLRTQINQNNISMEQAIEMLRKYRTAQIASGSAIAGSTRRMGQSQVITQQAGYQIGDFIVQVQSGTNAFVAFGQQATQVAGTLTLLGGKMVLLGTVLGVAIPLLTAIGAAMMRTRQAARESADGVETLEDRVKSLIQTLREWERAQEALRQGVSLETLLATENLDQAEEKLSSLREELDLLVESLSVRNGISIGEIFEDEQLQRILENSVMYREQLEKIAAAEQVVADLRAKQAVEQQREFDDRLQSYQNEIDMQRAILESGEDSARVRELAARQALQAEVARIQTLVEAEELTVAQGAALVKAAAEAAALTVQVEDAEDAAHGLAEELGISVDEARALAGIGFGNLWDGASAAEKLARNLALADRMAANYEGRENTPDGATVVNRLRIMSSRGYEVLPQTHGTPLTRFDENLLPPARKSSGGGGGGGGSAVQEFLTLFPELERQMEEHNETVKQAEASYNLLEDALESGLISQEEYKQKMLEVEAQYGPLGKALEDVGEIAKSISETVGSELNSAFSDVLKGTKTVGEALRDFAQNVLIKIAEELFNKMITQPLVSSLGSALGGISLFSANGNAFNNSVVVPFANGGVVSSPQMFAFANGGRLGVMGEAGPEAILPLSRGPGGKLGVHSFGGGSPVNVVVNNYSNEEAEVKQNGQNLEVIIGRVVSRDIQNGGPTYRAMRRTFGLRQPTTTRG